MTGIHGLFPEDELPTGKQHPVRCPQCLGSGMCGVEPIDGISYGEDGGGLYALTRCATCHGDGFVSASQADEIEKSRGIAPAR